MDTIHRFAGEHRWLSNFWPARVVQRGTVFATVEHTYQASKIAGGPDAALWNHIARARTPGEAKRLGRTVPFELVENWNSVRVDVMHFLLWQKFQHPALAAKLVATGDALLQEGNHWGDRFWGIDLRTGAGENQLGKLLMQERARLALQEDPALAG